MKSQELETKLLGLTSIGLNVVNSTVNETIAYIEGIENAAAPPAVDNVEKLVALEAEVSSANAGMARYHACLEAVHASDLSNKDAFLAFFAS